MRTLAFDTGTRNSRAVVHAAEIGGSVLRLAHHCGKAHCEFLWARVPLVGLAAAQYLAARDAFLEACEAAGAVRTDDLLDLMLELDRQAGLRAVAS